MKKQFIKTKLEKQWNTPEHKLLVKTILANPDVIAEILVQRSDTIRRANVVIVVQAVIVGIMWYLYNFTT